MLGVDLVGSRQIEPTHVGCLVGPDGSRRIQSDRLDDHRDDQGASDRTSWARQANQAHEDRQRGRWVQVPSVVPANVPLVRRRTEAEDVLQGNQRV
jgi:hypothetical protein